MRRATRSSIYSPSTRKTDVGTEGTTLMDYERGDKNANEKGYKYIGDTKDMDDYAKGAVELKGIPLISKKS